MKSGWHRQFNINALARKQFKGDDIYSMNDVKIHQLVDQKIYKIFSFLIYSCEYWESDLIFRFLNTQYMNKITFKSNTVMFSFFRLDLFVYVKTWTRRLRILRIIFSPYFLVHALNKRCNINCKRSKLVKNFDSRILYAWTSVSTCEQAFVENAMQIPVARLCQRVPWKSLKLRATLQTISIDRELLILNIFRAR